MPAAPLSPDSPAVSHGVGLFETILAIGGNPVHLKEHGERMVRSCSELGFPRPDGIAFELCVARAAREAGAAECSVRCVYLLSEPDLTDAASWLLHASAHPIPAPTMARREHGRAVVLPPTWSRSLPMHKTTSYAACALGLRHAITSGADEALFTRKDGRILEGTATNVFAVRGTTLVTSPVDAGVLPGVVRGWVLAQAGRLGFSVEERAPTEAEIREGAFFTGSLTGVAPIRYLDGSACASPGELFTALSHHYDRELTRTHGTKRR